MRGDVKGWPKTGVKTHSSVHLNVDETNKTYDVHVTVRDKKGNKVAENKGTGKCHLATACLHQYKKNFDKNCYELLLLRKYRDIFVSEENQYHYYEIAPYIVEGINNSNDPAKYYEYIYYEIVKKTIQLIECGKADLGYKLYKEKVLLLEKEFAMPILKEKVVNTLCLVRDVK